jgi:hypothetical protein
MKLTDSELLQTIAGILEALGPFTTDTPRHLKWRTTEQLLSALRQLGLNVDLQELDGLLQRYEAEYRGRLTRGLAPNALVRRAVYPDRTTALPLWGATSRHGQPWLNQPASERIEAAIDIPATRRVPASAPRAFLSHASVEEILAASIAKIWPRCKSGLGCSRLTLAPGKISLRSGRNQRMPVLHCIGNPRLYRITLDTYRTPQCTECGTTLPARCGLIR